MHSRALIPSLALALLALALPAPAGAYLRDFQAVKPGGPTTVVKGTPPRGDSKVLQMACPRPNAPDFMLGAVAGTEGLRGTEVRVPDLALNRLNLFRADGSAKTSASFSETDLGTRDFNVFGMVFCATPTATPPKAAGASLAGYVKNAFIVRAGHRKSDLQSDTVNSRLVFCPGPSKVIGGGYEILEPQDRAKAALWRMFRISRLGSGEQGLEGAIHETDLSSDKRRFGVYVICANVTEPTIPASYPGTPTIVENEVGPKNTPVAAVAKCPPGQLVIGGGGQVIKRGGGGSPPEDVVLSANRPFISYDFEGERFNTDAWLARASDVDQTGVKVRARAQAVCAPFEIVR